MNSRVSDDGHRHVAQNALHTKARPAPPVSVATHVPRKLATPPNAGPFGRVVAAGQWRKRGTAATPHVGRHTVP